MKPVTLSDVSGNSEQTRVSEPLPKHLWRVEEMPEIEGIRLPPVQIETMSLPMPQFGVGEAVVAATSLYFPEASQVQAFNMVIHESYKAHALKYLIKWNENIQNPYSGGFYLPARYKKNIRVILFNYQGEAVMAARLNHIWPTTINELDLPNSDGDNHKISVSFSVDAMIPEFLI
tara:strand:- start:3443 stop:3967 length:525 start_codon:yes stop_codon:yes gene_type:complete